ncbi:hypothetical protein M011DRAFT_463437 [Sporormia fimetaria CBS 119925]|uniref:Anaphase-promoting complex subunit 5 n=1 Tax=Sporormia fimetaria CBS 119925 TaxID=1340428 RepID=A0A6A6VMX0_9PLEO|nr:hypothetical protein M011DRAFT_463437 [Sporormia fimetaria CBS 119925]
MATRYLTAQKICVVVLVKLYCESFLPSSATIPVLSFILSQVQPAGPFSRQLRGHEAKYDPSISIRAFEEVLQKLDAIMPGRTLLDMFLQRLWDVDSFDALCDLFGGLGKLLLHDRPDYEPDPGEQPQSRITLAKTSPLGAFVRRASLEFTRLQFEAAVKLWVSFVKYRAPTIRWVHRLPDLAESGADINAQKMDLQPGDGLFDVAYGSLYDGDQGEQALGMDDLERMLDFQIEKLQRIGDRVPEEMKKQFRSMLSVKGVALRQSYLVQFFDAWRAGDYTSAFENIHRYYDYSVQTREKIHYQYALLHMAILQSEFGCFGEAMAAISETIATARENQDMNCLNYSLSWLQHMAKAHPEQLKLHGYRGVLGSDREGLAFLKAKAKETRVYSLLSNTLLEEAKAAIASGEPTTRAFEAVYQASYLHLREYVHQNFGHQMVMLSTLWSRLGISHLTDVHCDMLIDCYQEVSPLEEGIRAQTRRAFSEMQNGYFDTALRRLQFLDPSVRRTLKFQKLVYFYIGLIKLKRAIRRTDWPACTSLLTTLSPDSTSDSEVSFLLWEARIDYLLARGLYSEAFNSIEDCAAKLKMQNADVLQRTTVLLHKASLFIAVGKPERAFSVALRAASQSWKSRLMPTLWAAVGVLATVLNEVGEFRAAGRLVEGVLPQALEYTDQELTATLYSRLADSYMGLAGQEDVASPAGVRKRAKNVSLAEMYVERARTCYKRAEDMYGECEQLMKKAMIARLRGDEKRADEYAEEHNQVWDQARERIMDTATVL